MASRRGQTDILGRLTDVSEAALQQLGQVPGAERFLGVASSMKDRIDELQNRTRGIDAMEARIAELERQVKELSGTRSRSGASVTRKTASTARKTASTARKASSSTARKTSSSARSSGSRSKSGTRKKS